MQSSNVFKNILKFIGVLVALVLIAAVAIPIFFKDKLVVAVTEQATKDLNAVVKIGDVDLSLLRNFPRLTLSVDTVSVVGKAPFEQVPLFSADRASVEVDIMSVIKGQQPYTILGLHLTKPMVNVQILPDGRANYDITKPMPAGTPSDSQPFQLSLKDYTIKDGTVFYNDQQQQAKAQVYGLQHSGAGDFSNDVFDLKTTTQIDSVTYTSGTVNYLTKAKLDWKLALNVVQSAQTYTINQSDLRINDLQLDLKGKVRQLPGKGGTDLDLTFKAPDNNFKSLLSIIPNAYTKDFAGVKANGNFNLDGFIKGILGDKPNMYPPFAVNLSVTNGSFQYPNLPMGITNIQTNLKAENKTTFLDGVIINVPTLSMTLGSNPIRASFTAKTVMSNPDVQGNVQGKLNLADLAKAFPMPTVTTLSGVVNANVNVNANMKAIEAKQYEKTQISGTVALSNLQYKGEGTPLVTVSQSNLVFSPQFLDVQQFSGRLGKSDITLKGRIDNFLAYFSPTTTMTGNIYFRSNYFNADEWLTPNEPAAKAPKNASDNQAAAQAQPFNRFDFTIDGAINKLDYTQYHLTAVAAKGHFTPNKFSLTNSSLELGRNDFSLSGDLINAFDYLFSNGVLMGNMKFKSKNLNLNDFMNDQPVSKTSAPPVATEPIRVPKNIDMVLDAAIANLDYTNINMKNVSGKIVVKNQQARLVDVQTNTLGGAVAITGGYNSQPAQPTFDLKYDLKNINFREAFSTFNTIQKLAPIAQYLDGKFNTTMDMTGLLNNDLTPVFTNLNADGFIQTVGAILTGFKPLQAVGKQLNIDAFNKLNVQDTKNWFEVKNGMVEIKPFDLKMQDIGLNIGGSHGINNDMNYNIKAKIPRKLFDKNGLGVVNAGLNQFAGEAQKLGLNINAGEFINVLINLTGTINNPKVNMKFLGTEGKSLGETAKATAEEAARKALDSARVVAQQKLDEGKARAKEIADRAADSLQRVAKKKADEAMQRAKDEVAKRAGEVVSENPVVKEQVKKVEDKVGDVLGDKAKGELDKAKEKLDSWNPFGKKKKE